MKTEIIDNKLFCIIENEAEFEDFLIDNKSPLYKKFKNYKLNRNINWDCIVNKIPIKNFNGCFDGNNNTIYNFSLKTTFSSTYVGLFNFLDEALIKNLNINMDGEIKGKNCVGIIAGVAFNSCFVDINIMGNCYINTKDGYNLGLFIGELNNSYCTRINIDLLNSTIRGRYNIGGFTGLLTDTQVIKSSLHAKLSILTIKCSSSSDIFNISYISTLDELFKVYLKDELKNDYNVKRHLQILKSNNYTYDSFLKISNSELFKYNIDIHYILLYLSVRDRELENKYEKKTLNLTYLSNSVGGFIGYCDKSELSDIDCMLEGSIISEKYVGGFVGNVKSSCFRKICIDLNGNINGIKFYGIFCGHSIISEEGIVTFEDCKTGINTKINDILVDINTYDKFKYMCNTNYVVRFKDYIYPKYIYKLYSIDKLINNKTILHELFNCILTITQQKKLSIENIKINSENQILYQLKKLFSTKWNKLEPNIIKNLETIGFNYENYQYKNFPDIKWNQFTGKQKISALKLGFNQKIWDYNFVQEIIGFNSVLDYTSKFTIDEKIRNVLKFSINIDKLNLKVQISTYLRNIILIEIKRELISYLDNKNINVYYSDSLKFDFVVIISSLPNDIDIIENPLTIPIQDKEFIETNKELFLLIKLELGNTYDIIKHFNCNFNLFENLIKDFTSQKICISKSDISIKKYSIDNLIFIFNLNLKIDKYNEIINNDINILLSDDITKIINKYITNDISYIVHNYKYTYDTNINVLKLNYDQSIEPKKYALCVNDNFKENLKNVKKRYFNIYTNIFLNKIAVGNDLELLCFIGKNLIYRKYIDKEINHFKIPSSCNEELVLFKLYDNQKLTLYDIESNNSKDKINIYAIKNENYGTIQNPIIFNSYGHNPKEIISKNYSTIIDETDYQPYCVIAQIYFNNTIISQNDMLFVYDSNDNLKGLLKPNKLGYINGTIQSSGKNKEIFRLEVFIEKLNGFSHMFNNELILEKDINGTYINPINIYTYAKNCIDPEDYFCLYYNIPKDHLDTETIETPVESESVITEKSSIKSPSPEICKKSKDCSKFVWNIGSNNINKDDNRCINVGCDNFDCNTPLSPNCHNNDGINFFNWEINNNDCCNKKPFKYVENNFKCNHTDDSKKKYYIQFYKDLLDKESKFKNDTISDSCH